MILLTTNWILIAAAVIPAIFLLKYVNKMDKLEKESPALIRKLVFMGVLSTAGAMATETIGQYIINSALNENSLAYNIILYYVVVALSEEGFKYLLLKKKTWNNPEFNCQFDGVVYAVSVSLGFALWENIGYVFAYGLGTALIRAVTAVPGHACFGVFMGVFYGAAKRLDGYVNVSGAGTLRKLALLVPVLIHGTYDFICSIETGSEWVFIIFIGVTFFAAYKLVQKSSQSDRYI